MKNNKNQKIIKTFTTKDKKRISLEERFKNYKGKKFKNDFSWDKPVGKEIW